MKRNSQEERDRIINEMADVMLTGIERACKKGWIPKTSTSKDRVISGIMYIIAQELGNESD